MKKKTAQVAILNSNEFKIKMLNWSCRFNIFCFLDNCNYSFSDPSFECMLAVEAVKSITLKADNAFSSLKEFAEHNPGWLFGHLNYPEPAQPAKNPATVAFDDGFFFIPSMLLQLKGNMLYIESTGADPADIFKEVNAQASEITQNIKTIVDIQNRYSRSDYIGIIEKLKKHIQRGDCYEINFCQDFFAENASVDPMFLYYQLALVSPNPFAGFYKIKDKYCICASPERFLKKEGNLLVSQPIKGTSKRVPDNVAADLLNKQYLANSIKEQSENVMVVDLVRNDMSRICMEGSVTVKELFGIYSFPQVHQMISTIEGRVDDSIHWTEIIDACFPMGSMTGAPKKRVMELINSYETTPRGLFSGTIGYVNPEGDFDFNVIIRSLFYDEEKGALSFMAGSGITFRSNAEEEYAECMMKAAAIMKILENN